MAKTVKWSLVAVALVLWFPGLAWAQPVFSPSQDPLAGSRVFGTKGCATCHAVNGIGGTVGPDLGRIARPRSFYDLATAMWNHLPRMVERMQQRGLSRPHLGVQETADLIGFFYTLNYFDAPGNPDVGARYFAEKRCINCHQVGGAGGVVGPNLDFFKQFGSPLFVAAALWNHGPQMTETMKAQGIDRPAFIGPELHDLLAYLVPASAGPREGPVYVLPGRADTGRKLFAEKRCGSCHSAGGGDARVGPDLVGRGVRRSLVEFAAAMWNKAPAMVAAMKAQGISLPQLRPEEMADIVAYLYSVRYFADPGNSRTGLAVATEKGCLRCHNVSGERMKAAPNLGAAKGLGSPAAVIAALWNHPVVKPVGAAGQKGAWPEFRPEEMVDLVALLQSFGWTR
ncbi:MAG: c-type cytochrome [Candidatus Rokubacteria bacterium]|nr:c-type cytochrome [Candidatus Rokubacteria bacterium]